MGLDAPADDFSDPMVEVSLGADGAADAAPLSAPPRPEAARQPAPGVAAGAGAAVGGGAAPAGMSRSVMSAAAADDEAPEGRWIVVPPLGLGAACWRYSQHMGDRVPKEEVPHLPKGEPVRGVDLGDWVRAQNGLYLPKRFLVPAGAGTPAIAEVGRGVVVHPEGASVLATYDVPRTRDALEQAWLALLPRGTPLCIAARRGRRARLSSPMDGWVSVSTLGGETIVAADTRPPCDAAPAPGGGVLSELQRSVDGTVVEKGLRRVEDAVIGVAGAIDPDGGWERTARTFADPPLVGLSATEKRAEDLAKEGREALAGSSIVGGAVAEGVAGVLSSMASMVGLGPQEAQFTGGVYQILHPASITDGLSVRSAKTAELPVGSLIAVLEVRTLSLEDRVRGRVAAPRPGWVSLQTVERTEATTGFGGIHVPATGKRWAQPIVDHLYWVNPDPQYRRVAWRRSPDADDRVPEREAAPPAKGTRLRLQRLSGEWAALQRWRRDGGPRAPLFMPLRFLSETAVTGYGARAEEWDEVPSVAYDVYDRVELVRTIRFASGKFARCGEEGIVVQAPGRDGAAAEVEMPDFRGAYEYRPRFRFQAQGAWMCHAGRFAPGERVELVDDAFLSGGGLAVRLHRGDRGTVRKVLPHAFSAPGQVAEAGGAPGLLRADSSQIAVVEADPVQGRRGAALFVARRGWIRPADVEDGGRFAIGDRVTWEREDDPTVPEGSVGRVCGFFTQVSGAPRRVLVDFPGGTFSFNPAQLRPHADPAAEAEEQARPEPQPAAEPEAQPAARMEGLAAVLAAAPPTPGDRGRWGVGDDAVCADATGLRLLARAGVSEP